MKKYFLTALILTQLAWSASAQQNWTLENCINYALENNLTIKSTELSNQSQQIKLEQAKNQMLPDLSGSVSGGMNFGTGLDYTNKYVQQNSENANFGLSTSLLLFNGFRVRNSIEAQKYVNRSALEELKKAKESLAVNIASAYLQVLYNKEIAQLAEEQVKLSKNQLERSQSLATYGKIPEGQVFEAKAQLSKDQYTATESKNTLKLALLDLAQMLEIKDWKEFDIVVPDYDPKAESTIIESAEAIYDYAVSNKASVKSSEYSLQSSEKNLDISKGGYYPSVSLSASYSNRYFSKQLNPDLSKASLGDQLSVNGGSYIGVNVNIPIFNRFDTKNNIRLSKIEVERAKLEVENSKKTLLKEIQQAWFNAIKANENFASSSESLKNNTEAFRFAEEKYNNEKATIYEYNQAKMNLASAKSSQLQAKYNLLFCKKILDFYKGEPLKL